MKIRKGDQIMVIAGKEKGKKGRVDRLVPSGSRVIVEGLNMITRHVRPRPGLRQAGRIQQEAPIHVSNVVVICNKCSQPVRARAHYLEDGKKVRQCRKCNEVLD